MRRVEAALPEGYEIRFAQKKDIPCIMDFFKKHWSEKHIFANDRSFFEYEFCRDEEVCLVLLVNAEGDIRGTLGYIPYGKERRDIFTVMWKVLESEELFTGISLLYYLVDHGSCRHIYTSGFNESTRNIYRYLGFMTVNLTHYYMLNDSAEHVIAKIADGEAFGRSRPEADADTRLVPVKSEENFLNRYRAEDAQDKIVKSAEYMVHRYFQNPKYSYLIYEIDTVFAKKPSFLIAREQEYGVSRAFRIVDFVGDAAVLGRIGTEIERLLKSGGYEYADFYAYGVDDELMRKSGFVKKEPDSVNIIPNYFAPFCQKNINIGAVFEKGMHPLIFKGDGDQDRPSL